MKLIQITADNFSIASKIARLIFPNEIHDGVYWPEKAYKDSIRQENPKFAYYLIYDKVFVGIIGHYPWKEVEEAAGLGWFGVLKEYRRQQYGKKAIQCLYEILDSLDFEELRLYCAKNNKIGRAFYESLDFSHYYSGYVDGDAVVYYKKTINILQDIQ